MDQFVVSARKYRPATFNSVVGQQSITNTLLSAIKNNQLAHSFLFCGPRGVGKTTCARILSKAVNAENPEDLANVSDDVMNIFELDAASNNSVEDIRKLVDQVRVPPTAGVKYKTYIIDEVHMLSANAFNAFLKTLEEPPHYAIFILATTEKHKILPTILSRCQVFDFQRIQIKDIVDHLTHIAQEENIQFEPEALHVIAQKADGGLRDALSMFDQLATFSSNNLTYESVIKNLNILDYDYYFKVGKHMMENNIPEALVLFDMVLKNGFDGQIFLNGIGEHLRNLLMCKNPQTAELLDVGENTKAQYTEQAAQMGQKQLMRGLKLISEADINYKTSKNQRLLVEVCLMQLCSIITDGEKKNDISILSPAVFADRHVDMIQPLPAAKPITTSQQPQATTPPPTLKANMVEEEAPKPAKKPKGSVKLSGFGIKKTLQSVKKTEDTPVVKEAEDGTAIPTGDIPKDTFTVEQLQDQWVSYAQLMKSNGKDSFFTTLTTSKPDVLPNGKITFTVSNSIQRLDFEREQQDLLEYLRKQLNNFTLLIDLKLAERDEVSSLYTDTDKLKAMIKKNPALGTMVQKLNLEPEF